MATKVKLLVIGPKKSGKSCISDILSSHTDSPSQNYWPTVGCRIHQFQKELSAKTKSSNKILVELWDVSGDLKYEKYWPAIQRNTQGIIFVYDSTNPGVESEINTWVAAFPKSMQIHPSICLAFANKIKKEGSVIQVPKALQSVQIVDCSAENIQQLNIGFDKYIQVLMKYLDESQEKETNNLINNQK